jgi:hypothetical protein
MVPLTPQSDSLIIHFHITIFYLGRAVENYLVPRDASCKEFSHIFIVPTDLYLRAAHTNDSKGDAATSSANGAW